jgi:P4 family phage/plasmid primase-like protien
MSSITLDDVCSKKTDKDGNVTYEFARSKASEALRNKITLVMAEGSDKIWWFGGQIYHDSGKEYIKNLLYSVAGDEVDKKTVNEVLDRVSSRLQLSPVVFNSNPCLLGLANGVMDCKTSKFRRYVKEDLITDQLPINYDSAARCPEIIKFIEDLTPDYDDRITLIDIFASGAYRKALAYIAFLIGHGSSGSTTYIDLLQAFYGEGNTEAIPLNELVEKQFALSSLKNARFSIGQEIEDVKKSGTARIKEISGGDWISADVKNKERARFRGWTKLIFKGNGVPRFSDNTWGFRRRFTEVKLPYKFVPIVDPAEPNQRKMDPDIINKITSPDELSGLLNLIAVRLPRIIENNRIYKAEGQFEAYKQQVDSVTSFLDLFCTYYPDAKSIRLPVKKLYNHFQKWCTLSMANEVDVRHFGGYVKRYCDNKPSLETTIDDKTATVYPGLAFDEDKYEEEITKLQSLLANGSNRNINGSDNGLKSSQQILITGYTGLKSIKDSTIDISCKDLWLEIVSLYGEELENVKNDPVLPVFDKQHPYGNPFSNSVKPDTNPVVQEFLADGGQASLQRFLAEFPEAAGGST